MAVQLTAGVAAAASSSMLMPLAAAAEVTPSLRCGAAVSASLVGFKLCKFAAPS